MVVYPGLIGICGRRISGEPGKNSRSKARTDNKLNKQLWHRNRTQATLEQRGERFNHRAIPARQVCIGLRLRSAKHQMFDDDSGSSQYLLDDLSHEMLALRCN